MSPVDAPSWSFTNARLALESNDSSLFPSLRIFLLAQRRLLLDPKQMWSTGTKKLSEADLSKDSILINGIEYSLPKEPKIALSTVEFLSLMLKISPLQTVRCIVQAQRLGLVALLTGSQEERKPLMLRTDAAAERSAKETAVYAAHILKEKSALAELLCTIFRTNGTYEYTDALCDDILLESERFCLDLIDVIKTHLQPTKDEHVAAENAVILDHLLGLLLHVLIPIPVPKAVVEAWFSAPLLNLPLALRDLISLTILGFSAQENSFVRNSVLFEDGLLFARVDSVVADPLEPLSPLVLCAWWILSLQKYTQLESKPDETFLSALGYSTLRDFMLGVEELQRLLASIEDVYSYMARCAQKLAPNAVYTLIIHSFACCALSATQITPQTAPALCTLASIKSDALAFVSSASFAAALAEARPYFPGDARSLRFFIDLLTLDGALADVLLDHMTSYYHVFGPSELEYRAADNGVVSSKELTVRLPFDGSPAFTVPAGTALTPDPGNPHAAAIEYAYSGWAVLGRVFEALLDAVGGLGTGPLAKLRPAAQEAQLLDRLLVLFAAAFRTERAERVADALCTLTPPLPNLLGRVADWALRTGNPTSLTNLNRLFIELLASRPQDVWTAIVRTRYALHVRRALSRECTAKEYSFSMLYLDLVDALMAEALRYNGCNNVTQDTKLESLLQLVDEAIRLFEGLFRRSYEDVFQRGELGTKALSVFVRAVRSAYTTQARSAARSAGERVAAAFWSPNGFDALAVRPFQEAIAMLLSAPHSARVAVLEEVFCRALFEYATLLVTLRSAHNPERLSVLETSLLESAPQLVRVYVERPALKRPVMALLTCLTRSVYCGCGAPQSPLLAYLGHENARVLVAALVSDLDGALLLYALKNSLCDFFAAATASRQEGVAVMLMGLERAGREHKEKKQSALLPLRTPLAVLKLQARALAEMPADAAEHVLDALSVALDTWSAGAAMGTDDAGFVSGLVKFFQARTTTTPTNNALGLSERVEAQRARCADARLLRRVGEVFALYLHRCADSAVVAPILDLLQPRALIDKYLRRLFGVAGYDPEIEANCAAAFEAAYPGHALADFRRAPGTYSERDSAFDNGLMDAMFAPWSALRVTVVEAGLSRQWVSAQTQVLRAWSGVMAAAVRRSAVQPEHVELAAVLLKMCIDEGMPGPEFAAVWLERVELAFFLVYGVSKGKVADAQLGALFGAVSGALLLEEVNFAAAAAGGDATLYRPLLRILSVTLDLCCHKAYLLEKELGLLMDVISKVVATGLRIAIGSAMGKSGRTEDLVFMVALFRLFAAIEFLEAIFSALLGFLESLETLKGVLALYGHSQAKDEPVHAELALMYIVEMINVQAIAEKLMANGLVLVLINSPILVEIHKGGVRADLQPRMHHIWSDGLLTVVLVLLSKFGPRVIPDACAFVRFFRKQIDYTISNWTKDLLVVTPATVHETSQLVLLCKVLEMMNYREYIGLHLNAEFFPGLDTELQKRKLVESFNHLLSHPKYLQLRIVMWGDEDDVGDVTNTSMANASFVGKSKRGIQLMNEIRELCETLESS